MKFSDWVLNEINIQKFNKEIEKAKGNRNRLQNLKATIKDIDWLPSADKSSLLSRISNQLRNL